VRLRRQIVDLVGLGFLDDAYQVGAVGHVSIVEDQPLIRFVGVLIEMFDPTRIERR
jgi:hypothetical protein